MLAAPLFVTALLDLRTSLAAETLNYPVRPVRIVVPQSPGGTTDFTARLIGPRLSERFGQSVVIDNRPGAGTQLTAELLKSMAGINIVHVPYKGGGPALTALLAGEVQLMFAAIPSTLPMARSGKLRALAVTSAKRSAAAPEVPSMAEAGLPGYDELTWNGLLAPARLPAALVNKIYADVDAVLKTPQVRERFAGEGAEIGSMAPAVFGKLIPSEIVKWAKVTREAGIKAE